MHYMYRNIHGNLYSSRRKARYAAKLRQWYQIARGRQARLEIDAVRVVSVTARQSSMWYY